MASPTIGVLQKPLRPWTWNKNHSVASSDSFQQLVYCASPVPGVYGITKNKKRYLLAMRADRTDFDGIFADCHKRYHKEERVESFSVGNRAILMGQGKDTNIDNTRLKGIADFVFGKCSIRIKHTTVSSASSRTCQESTTFTLTTESTITTTSTGSTTKDILSGCVLSRLTNTKLDINGFRCLRKPHPVEYNYITGRYMFPADVKARTTTTHVEEYSPVSLKERKMFLLDDGCSWVKFEHPMLQWIGDKVDRKSVLYCVDGKTRTMRRQTDMELGMSKETLQYAKNKVCLGEVEPSSRYFRAVVRYAGLDFMYLHATLK